MLARRSHLVRPFIALAMVTASTLYALAQQPPTPTRVRGTVESVDGDTLAVKSRRSTRPPRLTPSPDHSARAGGPLGGAPPGGGLTEYPGGGPAAFGSMSSG